MQTILFTGGRSGLIFSVIEKIKNKNYHIYITVHTKEEEKRLKEKFKNNKNIDCFVLDVTKKNDREKLLNKDIDIIVCNAAIGVGGSISELDMEKVRENFEVNVFSNFEIVQIVLKNMIAKKRGKIVMMSSLAGIIPIPFLGSYCATKASIIKLTETLKQELKLLDFPIDIILVEPGLYHTGFNQLMLKDKYDWMQKKSYFKEELDWISKKENIFFNLLEHENFNSITKKIEKAITSKHSPFLVRAPFFQVLGAKLYMIFFE